MLYFYIRKYSAYSIFRAQILHLFACQTNPNTCAPYPSLTKKKRFMMCVNSICIYVLLFAPWISDGKKTTQHGIVANFPMQILLLFFLPQQTLQHYISLNYKWVPCIVCIIMRLLDRLSMIYLWIIYVSRYIGKRVHSLDGRERREFGRVRKVSLRVRIDLSVQECETNKRV